MAIVNYTKIYPLYKIPQEEVGYFPAQSDGNELIVYEPSDRRELLGFTFPRQREGRRLSISDFFAP